ncbi:hypothetical protein KKE92_06380, partial [Candidatus Micrarchaeota archaeon]|nr:hypothetical protein [Candidatus Micrarchaeota archaeon]MBU1681459.1 hypothetical protein [Candidatus Micrarchaeota archaeon]
IAIGAAFMAGKKQPITEPAVVPRCDDPITCPTPPRAGDRLCEVAKGEADPYSATFDPESCGYCGDLIRQVKAPQWSTPTISSSFRTQNVTERPSETPENCPVDFHCGNGSVDVNTAFGAIVANTGSSDEATTYSLETIRITESCNSRSPHVCDSDCGRVIRTLAPPDAGEDQLPPRFNSAFTCPGAVAPTDRVDLAASLGTGEVLSRLGSSLRTASSSLRTSLGIRPEDTLDIHVSIVVGPSGLLSLRSISAVCNGQSCGDESTISSVLSLNLAGLTVGAPGRECYWTVILRAS